MVLNYMKLIEFIKKFKIHILTTLVFISFFRSCSKNRKISILEQEIISISSDLEKSLYEIDSIESTVKNMHYADLDSIDTWISSKDRGAQLMELHPIIKEMKSNAYSNK